MSIFDNKINKSVAEAVMKVMQQEELKGNQHKIDANKNGKVDAHDFKLLRAGKKPDMKKEDVEQLDEVGDTPAGRKALSSYVQKALHDKDRQKGLRKATSRLYKDNYYGKKTNEEVEEQIDEAFPTVADAKKRMDAGKTEHGSVTKTATGLVHKRDYKDDDSAEDTQKKSTGYGARQNYKRSTRVNEQLSFTEMLELYNEHGLKVLAPIETEEMDIDGTTIEVIDGDKINGYVETTIEEGLGDAVRGAVGVVKDVISKEKAYQAQKQKKAGEVLSKMRREEVTNDEFTKEFKDQQASFEGKKKQPKVAAGKTMGVKTMPEEVEQLDELSPALLDRAAKIAAKKGKDARAKGHDEAGDEHIGQAVRLRSGYHNAVERDRKKASMSSMSPAKQRKYAISQKRAMGEEVELDERSLTSDEKSEMEKNVKGMKKKLSGFKERYGERAKEVMYATATKMAKKD